MRVVVIFLGITLLHFVGGSCGTENVHCSCRCGWLYNKGHCYFFSSKTAMAWLQAQVFCKRNGGYLVKVNDKLENEWLQNTIKEIDTRNKARKIYWIGASDAHMEGNWKWYEDFSELNFKGWDHKEPGNHGGKEHCAAFFGANYKWHDASCLSKLSHICEISAFHKPKRVYV